VHRPIARFWRRRASGRVGGVAWTRASTGATTVTSAEILSNAMTGVERAARAAGYGVLPRANFSRCRNEFEVLQQAIETGHPNYDRTRAITTRYEQVVIDPVNRVALVEQAGFEREVTKADHSGGDERHRLGVQGGARPRPPRSGVA
jgi:hypothetical protein